MSLFPDRRFRAFLVSQTFKVAAFAAIPLVAGAGPAWSTPPFTVEEAVGRAIRHAPLVRDVRSRYAAARAELYSTRAAYDWEAELAVRYADVDQPRTVIFQPGNIQTTEVEGAVERLFATGTRVQARASLPRTEDDSTFNVLNKRYEPEFSISLEQGLLQNRFGRLDRARLNAARTRLEAVEFELWRQIERMAAAIAEDYWRLWLARREADVLEAAVADARRLFETTERLSRQGLRDESEVLLARAAWLTRRQEQIDAQTAIQTAWIGLRNRIGADESDYPSVPALADPDPTSATALTPSPMEARASRGDLAAARRRLQAGRALLDASDDALRPALSATGGYSLAGLDRRLGNSLDDISNGSFAGWNVGLVFRHAFGQNADRADLERARAEFHRAASVLSSALAGADAEIANAFTKLRGTLDRLALAREIESVRRRIHRLFLQKFRQGRITMQDLLAAEEEARQARRSTQALSAEVTLAAVATRVAEGTLLSHLGFERRSLLSRINESAP